jgi:hypothetical protein
VHGRAEAEIPPLGGFKTVDVLQLIIQGAGLIKRNLGKTKGFDGVPPVIIYG